MRTKVHSNGFNDTVYTSPRPIVFSVYYNNTNKNNFTKQKTVWP